MCFGVGPERSIDRFKNLYDRGIHNNIAAFLKVFDRAVSEHLCEDIAEAGRFYGAGFDGGANCVGGKLVEQLS